MSALSSEFRGTSDSPEPLRSSAPESPHADEMQKHVGSFDFILDAVAADHDINAYIQLLRHHGQHHDGWCTWQPSRRRCLRPYFQTRSFWLTHRQYPETEEMLDFCMINIRMTYNPSITAN